MAYPGGAPVTIVGGQAGGAGAGTAANPLMTSTPGSANVATSQAASSISPAAGTLLVAARANRRSVTITNITGAQPIYVGGSGVTVATGDFIPGTAGSSKTYPTTAALYGTSPTAAQTVSVVETY